VYCYDCYHGSFWENGTENIAKRDQLKRARLGDFIKFQVDLQIGHFKVYLNGK